MTIGFDGSRISVSQRTGTENYSYQLLKHLLAMNSEHQYRIYSRQALNEPDLEVKHAEHKVISWPRLWTQVGLSLEIFKRTPDLLFIPAHTLPVLRPSRLKTVVTIHDLGAEYLPQYHKFPGKLYLNRATEYAASHASHLIAVSDFTKRDLVKKLHVDPNRVNVIYEGVDTSQLKPASSDEISRVMQKHGLTKPYILFVGTVQPRKNLVGLIEAVAKLDHDVDLVIAGGRGWLSEEIYAAPARLNIEDKVKFLGYIDESDKPALYSGAELTALVSFFEGFGLPMIESMACGTPVVAANASCLPEIAGAAGILVDPYDSDDIAQGLANGLENTNLRQQLRVNGFAQAAKFNWEDTAKQTLDLFERVLNQ